MINKNPRLIGGKSVRFTSYPGGRNTAIALVDEVGFQPRLEFERYIKRLILSPVKPKNPMCGNGDLYTGLPFFLPLLLSSFFLFFSFFITARNIKTRSFDFSFSGIPLMNYDGPLTRFLSTFRRIIVREKLCT